MADKSEPKIWGLATESDIGTVFREAEIAVTCQDASLVYTAALNPFVPLPEGGSLIGRSDEAVFEGRARNLIASKRRVVESGKGESLDLSYALDGRERWYRIRLEPIEANGDGRGILAASVDITQQKTAEEHLRLALLELAHRSKNLLAVVLSLARQSADDSRDLSEFRGRFLGRIRALALAHDILTEEAWRGATVFSLVRGQLGAFSETASEQSRIEGHNAFLKPNAVQYVGLALHELIAHSLLSGALARPEGRVEVESRLEGSEENSPVLCLVWRETGRQGGGRNGTSEFGHALLQKIVPMALGGSARLEQTGDGAFLYELRIPSSQFF
ncbi:MAG TPA: HWE histidine kinase domain-containing protein [Bauldia sp.]|nr:HWE histidine kinase domain-containing protein [Bauldia sp.]